MCCMILVLLLYANDDDDSSLICLTMQIKMWNLGTWITFQS